MNHTSRLDEALIKTFGCTEQELNAAVNKKIDWSAFYYRFYNQKSPAEQFLIKKDITALRNITSRRKISEKSLRTTAPHLFAILDNEFFRTLGYPKEMLIKAFTQKIDWDKFLHNYSLRNSEERDRIMTSMDWIVGYYKEQRLVPEEWELEIERIAQEPSKKQMKLVPKNYLKDYLQRLGEYSSYIPNNYIANKHRLMFRQALVSSRTRTYIRIRTSALRTLKQLAEAYGSEDESLCARQAYDAAEDEKFCEKYFKENYHSEDCALDYVVRGRAKMYSSGYAAAVPLSFLIKYIGIAIDAYNAIIPDYKTFLELQPVAKGLEHGKLKNTARLDDETDYIALFMAKNHYFETGSDRYTRSGSDKYGIDVFDYRAFAIRAMEDIVKNIPEKELLRAVTKDELRILLRAQEMKEKTIYYVPYRKIDFDQLAALDGFKRTLTAEVYRLIRKTHCSLSEILAVFSNEDNLVSWFSFRGICNNIKSTFTYCRKVLKTKTIIRTFTHTLRSLITQLAALDVDGCFDNEIKSVYDRYHIIMSRIRDMRRNGQLGNLSEDEKENDLNTAVFGPTITQVGAALSQEADSEHKNICRCKTY